MPGSEVRLIIKAPNQNVDDHTVDCDLEWTVRQLKEHLLTSYPNNPAVNEQKLIYSGHILQDDSRLQTVLRHEDSQDSVYILHLVYNSPDPQKQPVSSQSWSSGPTQSSSTSPYGLVHRNVASSSTANAVHPPSAERLFPDPQLAAQINAIQQMYTYYFTQYLHSLPPPPPSEAPPEPRRAPPEDHRDWLDHLFVFLRFVVLFCAVYFYSTPERLMIVMVFAIIALLYVEGWFVRRPEPGNIDQEVNDDDEHDLEAAMDGEHPPHAHPPAAPHIFSPLTFLSAFFSSLIPVNIN